MQLSFQASCKMKAPGSLEGVLWTVHMLERCYEGMILVHIEACIQTVPQTVKFRLRPVIFPLGPQPKQTSGPQTLNILTVITKLLILLVYYHCCYYCFYYFYQ